MNQHEFTSLDRVSFTDERQRRQTLQQTGRGFLLREATWKRKDEVRGNSRVFSVSTGVHPDDAIALLEARLVGIGTGSDDDTFSFFAEDLGFRSRV